MSSVWGRNIRISIFGESHGEEIGVTIDNFPCGVEVDGYFLKNQLERRKPSPRTGTERHEEDTYRIIGGVYKSYTAGSPITAIFQNVCVEERSTSHLCRPSQSDYAARAKYLGFNDPRSGGHFSARLTAPFVFAGGLAMLYLRRMGIEIGAHILSVYNVFDKPFGIKTDTELLKSLKIGKKCTLDPLVFTEMTEIAARCKQEGDSLGGVIECAAAGLEAGIGSPVFNSLESDISALLFSIPSVKGVEFGGGFNLSGMRGSESNDDFIIEEGKVKTSTNNSGGIQGGISNGMPIIVRAAFKPVPSIGKEQVAYDPNTNALVPFFADARNDSCAVLRAAPCVESALAIAILDNILF